MSRPLIIDVVMPARNAASTIRSAVESIQRQTITGWRLVVIDDGSADTTHSILTELAEQDDRILILKGSQQGVVGSLNLGLEHCRAPVVARQDSDDIAYPDRLERQLATLTSDPECVAVGCDLRHIDKDGVPTGSWGRFPRPETSDPHWVPASEPYIAGPVFMARREALEAIGGFRFMRVAEDSDLCWRLQERGRLHNAPEVLADYRMHPDSITSRSIRLGRVNAVCSQRSALSAQRRRSGRPDLEFSQDLMVQQEEFSSIAALIEQVSVGLDAREVAWLTAASAAKLIELVLYRPFELEGEDCRFIIQALRGGDHLLSEANRTALAQMLLLLSARLAIDRRFRDVFTLVRRNPILPSCRSWLHAIAYRVRLFVSTRAARLRGKEPRSTGRAKPLLRPQRRPG